MSSLPRLYDSFGSGDAAWDLARAENADPLAEFVSTKLANRFLDRDPTYTAVVGSKGAGKSILLFRKAIQLKTAKDGACILPKSPSTAYSPTSAFSNTEQLEEYWQLVDRKGRPNHILWEALWQWALMVTVLQQWRNDEASRPRILTEQLHRLLQPFRADDPFKLITQHLNRVDDAQFKGIPRPPQLDDLEDYIRSYGSRFPPTYLFIDNHDDYFQNNPRFWKASSYGAFRAGYKLAEISNHRLHFLSSLRPEVYWELRQSEHFPRYSSSICRIHADDTFLLRLFRDRAARLQPEYLKSPEYRETDAIRAFIGDDLYDTNKNACVLSNPTVGADGTVHETFDQYLLRHTLGRPREIILLGNALIDAIGQCDPRVPTESIIRNAINKTASEEIGRAYVAEVSHRWPYCVNRTPKDSISHFITRYIKHNIIRRSEAEIIQERFAREIDAPANEIHPFCYLAAFGLIGWPEQDPATGRWVQSFVRPGEDELKEIPGQVECLLVHPVLYGHPFNVSAESKIVVGSGLPINMSILRN